MTHKDSMDILDILLWRGRNILVIVEFRRPHCWFCGAAGKDPATKLATVVEPKTAAIEEAVRAKISGETPQLNGHKF